MVAQEQQGAGAERKANWREKAGFGLFASLIGAAGLYFLLGGVGYLVTSNNYARLNPPIAIEGKVVRYEERQPVKGFWRYFPFVDRDGKGITNVTTPEGGLVAKLTDNNNTGTIEKDDIVKVVEEVDGIRGTITYHDNKVVDSDGKTKFTKPSTVLQARILERGRQQRSTWNSWLQVHYPTIKAKLLEQQQQYQQQRK